MGTNYYAYEKPCPCCGRGGEPKHIGKSSGGWCFALHIIPEDGIETIEDWQKVWAGEEVVIRDEYDDTVTPEEMLKIITERYRDGNREDKMPPPTYPSWSVFYEQNHAIPGPNNMLRSKLDGHYCVGHGDGPWDYIAGDFS